LGQPRLVAHDLIYYSNNDAELEMSKQGGEEVDKVEKEMYERQERQERKGEKVKGLHH
jgi:hypothetical protein